MNRFCGRLQPTTATVAHPRAQMEILLARFKASPREAAMAKGFSDTGDRAPDERCQEPASKYHATCVTNIRIDAEAAK